MLLLIFIVNILEFFLWQIKKGVTIANAFQEILD